MIPRRGARQLFLIFAFATVTLGACAYYNTFYHARQFYGQAEKARAEAPDDRREGVGLDLYEKAMKKCAKVIIEYPDSRWVDDAILLMGKCFLARGDYIAANRKFDEILLYYEKSNLVREARFMKAKTLVALERREESLPMLREFQTGKKDDLRQEALFLLALIEYEEENYAGAAEGFEQYLDRQDEGHERDRALVLLAESYAEMGEHQKAYDTNEERLKNPFLDRDERLETSLKISETLVGLGRFDEARSTLDEVRREVTRSADSLLIRFHEGEILFAEGKSDEGIEFLREALIDPPSSEAAAKIAYLLGETWLYDYDNVDSAAAAYRKVATWPAPDEIKLDAAWKSKHLGEYLDLKAEYAEENADTARIEFLLAEKDLFFFLQPDSANARYCLVSDRYPDSELAPRAIAARIYLHDHDFVGEVDTDSLLRHLVRRYPKCRTAVECLDRGDIWVEEDSLLAWTAVWEEAHPEVIDSLPDSTAAPVDEIAVSEAEEIPAGSEGLLETDRGKMGIFLEGPPAPLRLEKRVEATWPLLPPGVPPEKGFVEVEVEVNSEGKVETAAVLRSSAAPFEGPALAAAYQCRYVPAQIEGTRTTSLEFDFRPGP